MSDAIRLKAALVHEIIREEGEEELARSVSALAGRASPPVCRWASAWVVEGLLHHYLPDAQWRPLIASFGYTTGFVIVVLGRQQLFTENTLTGVIPGADPARSNLHRDFLAIGERAASGSFVALFVKAVLAGWLIGLMVWLLPGAGSARLIVILLITYVVALGGFAHIIAGSVEVLYLVLSGDKSFFSFLFDYAVPVLAGNIVGGSALVAMLNHAQVQHEVPAARKEVPDPAGD